MAPGGDIASYAVDGMIPTAAVRPPDLQALAEVVGDGNDEGLAIVPFGGGTQRSLGNPPRRYDLALDTRGLDRVVQYEPADLTVTVEAGMSLAGLDGILAAEGQFLPLETPRPLEATVGGMLAAASAGPLSLSYGFPRDWLIGVKVVNGDGAVTKGGGRVVKNVTGYDMSKLYTGSLGTLGVIVEASFKVSPKPDSSVTLTAEFDSLGGAIEGAWGMLEGYGAPNALTVLNPEAAERLRVGVGGHVLMARFLGREGVVRGRVSRGKEGLRLHGAGEMTTLEDEKERSVWQSLVDLPWSGGEHPTLSIRSSVLPSEVGELLEKLSETSGWNLKHGLFADIGTGLVRSVSWGDAAPIEFDHRAQRVISQMTEMKAAWVVENCRPESKSGRDVWGPLPPGLRIMRRLKLSLDPHGILNPGRFVGGI